MDEQTARALLDAAIPEDRRDKGLYCLGWYLGWSTGEQKAVLDGEFTADELEAVAWWMRNMKDEA